MSKFFHLFITVFFLVFAINSFGSSAGVQQDPNKVFDGKTFRLSPADAETHEPLVPGVYSSVVRVKLLSGDRFVYKFLSLWFAKREQCTDAWLINALKEWDEFPEAFGCFDASTPEEVTAHRHTLGLVLESFDWNLWQLIKSNVVLTRSHVLSIGQQVFASLARLHSARIVHSDVKPENILLQTDCRVALTDFGLSVPLSTVGYTSRKAHIGTDKYTFCYRPPELIDAGHKIGKKLYYGTSSDIYAGAITVAELLIRRRLFSAPSEDSSATQAVLRSEQERLWDILHASTCPALTDTTDPFMKRAILLRIELEHYPEGVRFFRELLHHTPGLRPTADQAARSAFWEGYATPEGESLEIPPSKAEAINSKLTELRNTDGLNTADTGELMGYLTGHFPLN